MALAGEKYRFPERTLYRWRGARHPRMVRVPPLRDHPRSRLDQALIDRAAALGITLVPPSEREAPAPNEPTEQDLSTE